MSTPAPAPVSTDSALPRWAAAVIGIAAVIAGVGVGHLVAALVSPGASPVLAVGAAVIDLAPTPLKSWAITTFGTADKPVLLGTVTLVTLALAALAGLIGRRDPRRGAWILLVLGALAAAAAIFRPTGVPTDIVPALAATFTGIAAFHLLLRRARNALFPERSSAGGPNPTRRVALGGGVLAAGGLATAALGQRMSTAATTTVAKLPRARRAAPPLPPDLALTVPGIAALRTPNADFYRIDTALLMPNLSVEDWQLTIDGDVENPFTLTFEQLIAMPMVEHDITLACVSNEVGGDLVGGARWLGVPVRELLARAKPRAGVDQILSTSSDGFTCSTPLSALTDGRDALIAVGMNGSPLPRAHGFPVRLVTPGLYGYVGATKWLTRLSATTYAREPAYWSTRGWSERGPIKPSVRIDTPRTSSTLPPGRVAIGGTAWAQHQGVVAVQVQIDDGPWLAATLGTEVNIDYWRQWYLPWQATPGTHSVRARCLYGPQRQTQTSTTAPPAPDGSSGYHQIEITVE